MAVEPLLHCHIPFDVISNGAMANGFTAEGLNLDHAWDNTWTYAWDKGSLNQHTQDVENAQFRLGEVDFRYTYGRWDDRICWTFTM